MEHTDGRIGIESKVEHLRRPEAYPEPTGGVEAVETHMSWVFLTDRHAYKLKKPVRYAYLDFSTPEARRADGEREVRLNRRLAADVYLALVPLTLEPTGRIAAEGEGRTIDWLVKMRRLPAERMLDRLIETGQLDERRVQRAAEVLARFYRRAERVELPPERYIRRLREDIEASRRELSEPSYALPADPIERVAAAQLRFLDARRALLEQRIRDGRIVEAHGDLRPQHICLIDPEPVVIDCLEFNRDFRLLDAASELSYLALECERLGAAWVGEVFLATYARRCDDRPDEALLGFYKSFHACLRAKIAIWHLREERVPTPDHWPQKASHYLQLAAGHLGVDGR